jgi:hypothetical protein
VYIEVTALGGFQMTRVRLAVATLLLLIARNALADLRVLDVDPRYTQEVYAALTGVLVNNPAMAAGGLARYGSLELLPSGQILIEASPETLVQVEAVLDAIRDRPVEATPRVTLRYWAVLGTRGSGAAANALGTEPSSLLAEVLTELRRIHGDLTFRVIGTAAVASESGRKGEVGGMTLGIEQTAYAQGEALNADIRMILRGSLPDQDRFNIGNLTVRTTLQRGEFVVIGEGELHERELEGLVFYVVHWPENE